MSERTGQMTPGADPPSTAEVANEASVWLVGVGIVAMALFPFALPFVLLGVAFLLPVLPLTLAPALVAGVIAAPILLARRLLRGRATSPARSAAKPLPRSAHRPA
jgi:hypothetical protein